MNTVKVLPWSTLPDVRCAFLCLTVPCLSDDNTIQAYEVTQLTFKHDQLTLITFKDLVRTAQ